MTIPFAACAAITAVSALVSLGFSIAAVPNTTGPMRTLAYYAIARSIAFAVISGVPFLSGSLEWLEAVAVGMIVVQVTDAVIGISIRDRMKTLGPAGTALANLAALVWLLSR